MFKQIKGILCDYGGTLDTPGHHWANIIWKGYKENGVDVTEDAFREAYVYAERTLAQRPIISPTDHFGVLMDKKLDLETSYLAEHGLWNITKALRMQTSKRIACFCYNYARRNINANREALSTLSAHYPIVLVSNFYGNIETILKDFGIDHLFCHVIESAVVGIRKPNPAIFQLGIDFLKLNSNEVLVVGDTLSKDMLPAHSLGCHTAWIKGMGWKANEEHALQDCPDVTLHQFSDLLQLLSVTD